MVMAGTCRPGVATFQATANGRLAHAGFGLSALDRTKRVLGERVLGMDGVSVMRSPLEPEDGPGRHPSDEGTDNDTATVGAPFAKIWVDDATTADDQQDGDVFRMQPFPTVQKGGARTTCYGTCFTVCALVFCGATLGGAGDVGGLRFRRLGRASACGTFQPNHNQNRNSCWNSYSFFRLLASRVSKLSGRSYRCFQIHSRRSR